MQFINCPKISDETFNAADRMFGVNFTETVNAAKFGGIDATYVIEFYRLDGAIYRVSRQKRRPKSNAEVRLVWIPAEVGQLEAEERAALKVASCA